jgi:predicted permease
LLTESVLLAVGGGIVGAALAVAAVKAFVALAPAGTPRLTEIHAGSVTIAATIAITTLSTLFFAIAPIVTGSRVDAQEALRSGAKLSGGTRRVQRGARALVVAQMAIAVLVLCVAGLVARSLASLARVPVAADPSRLLVVELALPKRFIGQPADSVTEAVSQLSTTIANAQGVRAVAPVFTRPFASVGGVFGRIAAEGQTADEKARNPVVDYELATPDEFAIFGTSLVRGRAFSDADRNGSPSVAIVTESLARHYWPGANPIGKRLVRGPRDFITVVGVVSDTHYRDLRNPRPRVYLPIRQSPFPITPTTLIVSTTGDPSAFVSRLRQLVAEAAPGVAIASATPFETYVGDALAQPRMNALLLGLFAGAAILLAAVGLFGVTATMVRQRARELSLRLALGASPNRLRFAVLRSAFVIACAGLAVGIVAALAITRTLRALLFGVSPVDPMTLGASSALLLVVAIVAAYIPAARAQRADPALVLRAE